MEMIVDFFIICASLRFYIFFFFNSASCFKSLQNSHPLAMVWDNILTSGHVYLFTEAAVHYGIVEGTKFENRKMAMREDSLLDSPVSYNSFQRSIPLRASKINIGNLFINVIRD